MLIRILFSYLFEAGCYYVLLSIELEQEDAYEETCKK